VQDKKKLRRIAPRGGREDLMLSGRSKASADGSISVKKKKGHQGGTLQGEVVLRGERSY